MARFPRAWHRLWWTDLPWGDAPTVCTRLVRGGVLGRLYGIAVEGIQDDTLARLDRMRPSAIEIKAIEAALDERSSRRGVRF